MTEDAGGDIAGSPASGADHFTDTDGTPGPSGYIYDQSVSATDAQGNSVQLASSEVATLEFAFTIAPEESNSNDGAIDWNYDATGVSFTFALSYTIQLQSVIVVSDFDGNSAASQVTISLKGAVGLLFTYGADTVDFNNLSPEQQTAVENNPTDIYSGLGGDDTVTLPDVANYVLGTTGVTWDPSQTFVETDTAGQDVTINGGDGVTNVQVGDGDDTINLGGMGGKLVAGNGNDTITGGSGAYNVTLGAGRTASPSPATVAARSRPDRAPTRSRSTATATIRSFWGREPIRSR